MICNSEQHEGELEPEQSVPDPEVVQEPFPEETISSVQATILDDHGLVRPVPGIHCEHDIHSEVDSEELDGNGLAQGGTVGVLAASGIDQ